MTDNKMLMYSGQMLDFDEFPYGPPLNIKDLARSLAYEFRYRAQTPVLLNVARHSILVCELVGAMTKAPAVLLAALLHDIEEAFTGDIVTPVKALLDKNTSFTDIGVPPQLKDELASIREAVIDRLVPEGFFLPDCQTNWQLIDDMDKIALFVEAEFLEQIDEEYKLFTHLRSTPGYQTYLTYMEYDTVDDIRKHFISCMKNQFYLCKGLHHRCSCDEQAFLQLFTRLKDDFDEQWMRGN